MVYCILFAAAFMFFILDRKIRFAVIPGTVVTFLSWLGLIRYAYGLSRERPMDFYFNFPNQKIMTYVSFVSPAVLIMCFALISTLALSAMGKNIGRYIFDPSKNTEKAGKTAKLWCVISSAVVTAASILYLVLYSLKSNLSHHASNAVLRFSMFYGIPPVPKAKMGLFITLFVTLLVLSIAYIILLCINRTMIREISANGGATKTAAAGSQLKAGIILACAGNVVIWVAAFISLNYVRHIIFFWGKELGYLSIIGLILCLVGEILLIIGLNKKSSKIPVSSLAISSALLVITVTDQYLVSIPLVSYLVSFFRSLYSYRIIDYYWLYRIAPGLITGIDTILLALLTAGTVITLKFLISSSSKKKI